MLDYTSLSVYTGALFVAAILPGPGVAALIARVLGRGARESFPFMAGMLLGDLIWLSLAIGGLAVLAQKFHLVFLFIRYAGAAYLFWLAWKLWTASSIVASINANTAGQRAWRGFAGGLSLTLGNPKVMVFYTALLPNLVDVKGVSPLAYIELLAVTALVLALVLCAYLALAVRARAFIASPRAMRILCRSCGTAVAGAAVAVAAR